METAANVTQVDKLLQTQSTQIYQNKKVRKYVLYSLLLPPLGLLLAVRERVLHLVLPPVLISESLVFGLYALAIVFLTKPALNMLGFGSGELFTGYYWWTILVLMVILIPVGVVLGFYYKHMIFRDGHLPYNAVVFMLALLLTHYVLGVLLGLYLNEHAVSSFGGLNSTLENLQETQDFLQQ